jgi:hypothetical protein
VFAKQKKTKQRPIRIHDLSFLVEIHFLAIMVYKTLPFTAVISTLVNEDKWHWLVSLKKQEAGRSAGFDSWMCRVSSVGVGP